MANSACCVVTTIALCGWDRIEEATIRLSASSRARAFGRIEHKATYKFPPIRGECSRFAVIALWNPDTEDRFRFQPRTQLFADTVSVIRYICFSRFLTTLSVRVLHTIDYFGDFGFFTTKERALDNLQHVIRFRHILRIPLKAEKSDVGKIAT